MGVLSNSDVDGIKLFQRPEPSRHALTQLFLQPWLWCILLVATAAVLRLYQLVHLV